MKILKPFKTFAGTTTLTSNITITETAWTAGTYSAGTKRYVTTAGYEYDFFEALTSTSDNPVDGFLATPQTWKRLGKINKYSMFDLRQGTQSVFLNEIEITIRSTIEMLEALVILNVEAERVEVEITGDTEGQIYYTDISLIDYSGLTDWYSFYFDPQIALNDYVFADIPAISDVDIRVRFYNTVLGNNVKVGELALGSVLNIGQTLLEPTISINDYSRKEFNDATGTYDIEERTFQKVGSFTCIADTNRVSFIQRELAKIRATPTIFIGEATIGALIIFGFYKSFDIIVSNINTSTINIEVNGL